MNKYQLRNKINWFVLLLVSIFGFLLLRMPAIAESPRNYNELKFPPLAEVKIPAYERYQLDNGIVVYLVEDHDLPLVNGSAIIRTGSRLESQDKVGLAEITGELLRMGGTEKHPADQLNEILEENAASIETSIDTTYGNASFDTLTEDLETVFNLFTEVLLSPTFAEDKFSLIKNQLAGSIARRNDNPKNIASREFKKLIYGETSPYSRTIEYETLASITRQDVIEFYQKYFRPEQIILGIVGDFQPEQMKLLIQEKFGNWKVETPKNKDEIPAVVQQYQGNIFFVDQPQLTQSNIFLGHVGGTIDDPDYPVLSVINGVLNGYGGRLFNEVRSRQGLAYSVYGFWSAAYDYPGLFIAGGQTRSDATVEFIRSMLAEIRQLRTTPITPEELAYAKDSILNSFVFKFEEPSQTLSRLMLYEYYGYPADFIFQYQQGVKDTTIEDIQRAAKKYLKPEQIVTLVVGNSQEIQPPLTTLGAAVKTVDISIPQSKNS